jgi:putative LysE/RhtB family amino acid efflux pump
VHAFTVGFGLGFFVALQLGPLSLYLIRSTLRNGFVVGLAIAAGIAIIDLAYATLGAAGAAPLLAIGPLDVILGLLGAAVLVLLGARTLRSAFRIRLGEASEPVNPRRGFLTALSATASNPLTIASWAAIFSAASAAGAAGSVPSAVLLIVGVGLGSLTWDVTLATGTALLGRVSGERLLRVVDLVAGIGLICFGAALAYSVLSN